MELRFEKVTAENWRMATFLTTDPERKIPPSGFISCLAHKDLHPPYNRWVLLFSIRVVRINEKEECAWKTWKF